MTKSTALILNPKILSTGIRRPSPPTADYPVLFSTDNLINAFKIASKPHFRQVSATSPGDYRPSSSGTGDSEVALNTNTTYHPDQ